MALTTVFNASPYYDDASETNDFYRILFRPGYGLQARELTQLQTLLQYQIQRGGYHLFENGSKVQGADTTFDTKVKSLKLETAFSGSDVDVLNFSDKIIAGSASGARGHVVQIENATSTDQPTLIFQLLSDKGFLDGETINTVEDVSHYANTTSSDGVSGISGAEAGSSIASVAAGVFFVDGFYVQNIKQSMVVDKYNSLPTKRIGMTIVESVATSTTDSTLLDNAQGTTNYAAPGADRFKLNLNLTSKDLDAIDPVEQVADEKFIELLRVENGEKTKEFKYPIYAELEKTLARRTFDESGDYTVRPFGLQIVDNLAGNNSLISAGLEPGKAYVKGLEFETIAPSFVDISKGRDVENVDSFTLSSDYGNKLFIHNVTGNFDIKKHEIVDLHCVSISSVNAIASHTNALTIYQSTKVGTARIRQFDYENADTQSANQTHFHSIYSARLYDVRTNSTITGEVSSGSESPDFVNLPSTITSNVSEAYTGATLVVNTTLDTTTTSDTITIDKYIASGAIHTAICNTALSQNVLSNSTFTLSFKMKDVQSLMVPHSRLDQSANANSSSVILTTKADVDNLSRYNRDPVGNTILSDTNRNSMIFKYPYTPINNLPDGVTYTFKRFEQRSSDATGLINFSITTTGGTFVPGVKTLSAAEAAENFTVSIKNASGITDINGKPVTNGNILNFSSGYGREIQITDANTVSLKCSTSGSFTAEVISTVQVSNASPRTKSLIVGNVSATVAGTTDTSKGQVFFQNPNKVVGGKDNLMISDVFNLTRVVDSKDLSIFPNNTHIANSACDVTDRYVLDNGQRDNMYDHGSIILKPGATPPTGRILGIVDYFDPDTNPGFFAIGSYSSDIASSTGYNLYSNGTPADTFNYSTIPTFTSPLTGEIIELRDALDFRPIRANANNGSGANTVNDINVNTSSMDISISDDGGVPDPEFTFIQNIQYYLSRTDKIVLTRDREFKVLKGVSALSPATPPDDEDSMTLYTVQIPAYTFSLADISTSYVDNRRFTMRDIGKLERRLENLEYYTALTLLEKETAARDVTGEENRDSLFNPQGSRFKNGILVDPFKGHSIGDVEDESYNVSIDFDASELRPKFFTDNYKFKYNATNSSSVMVSGNVATLSYTSKTMISQPLSSNSHIEVNPFGLINYIGGVKCTPTSDTWFDTVSRPDVLVNVEGLNDGWQYGFDRNGHGSQWEDWSKIWSGVQLNLDPHVNTRDQGNAQTTRRSAKLTNQVFSRTGIKQVNIPDAIKRTIGNKIVDVSVIPFIRSQTIWYKAKSMKPSTNVFVFFDGVSANTTPSPYITISNISNTATHFLDGEIITQGSNTAEIVIGSQTSSTNTATLHINPLYSTGVESSAFNTGTVIGLTSGATGTISGLTTPTNSTQANTNFAGETSGKIVIPGGTFRTGERLIRILDTPTDNIATSSTFAEVRYAATGILSSREAGIISTRLPIARRDNIKSDALFSDQTRRNTTSNDWLNPLSQTFFVDKTQNPNGVMVKSVDVFFRQKATANTTTIQLPITLQIRPIRNNLPSPSLIVPLAEVTLRPEEVNAQSSIIPNVANTEHSTSFSFDAPLYLPPDEYALVFITNSKEYQLYTAISGKNVGGTTRRIIKQPNVGTLYESQNQSIPVADPATMIMFKLNRCEFSPTSGSLVVSSNAVSLSSNTANVVADSIKISTSTLEFSNTTQVYSYKSTNTSGDTSPDYNTIVPDQTISLNERIMCEANTSDEFYIKTDITSTDSKISPYIDLDRLNLIMIENDIDNGELVSSDFYITNGGANYNTSVEAVVSGGGTSNTATVSLTLTSNVITGVVVTGAGTGYVSTPIITVSNSSISNGTGATIVLNGETDNRGGNINAKYLTRKVTLEDGFDASDIKVIINAYKPEHSNIIVYAKVINSDDQETLDDKNFFMLHQETANTVYSINNNDVKEFIFKTERDAVTYKSNDVTFDKFKSFIIKVCLLTSKTYDTPRIKDLRAIALDD
jgi:hypothetical protein